LLPRFWWSRYDVGSAEQLDSDKKSRDHRRPLLPSASRDASATPRALASNGMPRARQCRTPAWRQPSRSLSAPAPHSAAAMVMSRLSSPMASWKRCSVFIHKGKVAMVATAPGFPPCIPATGPPAPARIQGRSTNRTPADAGNSVEAAPCARSVARGKTQLTSGSRQAVNRVVTSTERGIG
jgi:hypothetical protein